MLPGVTITLMLGRVIALPATPDIVGAIESIEVTSTDQGRSGFQITFAAGRSSGISVDYSLLENPLLLPFNRVIIIVTLNGFPNVLMDGIITNRQLTPGDGPNG